MFLYFWGKNSTLKFHSTMRKIKFYYMLIISLLLVNCSKEEIVLETDNTFSNETINRLSGLDSTIIPHICKTVDVVDSKSAKTNLAIDQTKFWENGQVIKVRFLNGSDFVQQKVITYAKEWEQYANIKFDFVTSGNADVRIEINVDVDGDGIGDGDNSSWSNIGRDALKVSQNEATMNFGWFDNETLDSVFRRTTLHEFGHALGAKHEHQSPASNIPWDEDAVYEHYSNPPNEWDRETIDRNLFAVLNQSTITNSSYDSQSIMHYPISNLLTVGDYSVGWNRNLSSLDKEFIGRVYPFDMHRLYRYWLPGKNHFYTTNLNELGNGKHGYIYEGYNCYIPAKNYAGTSKLYRYYNSTYSDHFYTANYAELGSGRHGWVLEGVIGYVYNLSDTGREALYRYYNPTIVDHFYTTNINELGRNGKNGWNYEGIVGYVVPK